MAQGLGYNKSNGIGEESHRRTFWVLYFMEKVSCFITGKVSVYISLRSPATSLLTTGLGSTRLKYQLCHPGRESVNLP
jgi:hypothetical protein